VALGPLGLLVALLAARRWRRRAGTPDAAAAAAPPLDEAEARRLDAELAAFDR
jgi:hypothetical protein